MRFLADENFPRVAVEALRKAGHDVAWICEARPGATDEAVLAGARSEERVLLTFDKDFGELAMRKGVAGSCGIVLFRLPVAGPALLAARVVASLATRPDWTGSFSVIEVDRVRVRRLGP
jgi:hypothetical protein